ncbi:hypothetical protein [Pseudonocardia sp. NPDC049154]|uniref:hypothetical protein n=1 Tax=Pseudonocardia sp. NPDC049154 TaxID=3155501 RepID=UPI003403F894
MNLAAVMDDLGEALKTIEGLRVFPYWAESVQVPAAVIGWPDPLTYDVAFARGADQVELPVICLVGKVDARTARDRAAAYANGSGPSSVKAAIEAHTPTAYSTVRVARCEFGTYIVASVEYLAATFFLDIIGTGA